MVILIFFALAIILRIALVPFASTFTSFNFGCFIVDTPKFSPLGASDNSDLVSSSREPNGQNLYRRQFADPIKASFTVRVIFVDQLHAFWILKRFHRGRECMPMLPEVCLLFGDIPFKFHSLKYHISMEIAIS